MNTEHVNQKIAVAEWTARGMHLIDKLEYFRSVGFNAISFLDQFFDHKDSGKPEILEFLKESDFTVLVHSSFGRDTLTISSIEYIKPRIEAVLRWLEKTKINIWAMNFDSGMNKNGFDLEATIKGVNYAYEQLQQYGIKVAFENWLESELELLHKIKNNVVSENIGMLLDLGHLNVLRGNIVKDGMTVDEYIQKIPFEIFEVHVSDNDGNKDQHLPPGKGNAPIKEYIRSIKKRGFNGVITLEFPSSDLNSEYWQKQLNKARDLILGKI